MAHVAFIGLGNMGGGMAANLVKAGHDVHAFDLAEAALAKARENGATAFNDARLAVAGVDAVKPEDMFFNRLCDLCGSETWRRIGPLNADQWVPPVHIPRR